MSKDTAKNVDNKWRRSVSFNKSKPIDAKMLKHIGRRNFSGYVKKLIMADIKSKESMKENQDLNQEVSNGIDTVVDSQNEESSSFNSPSQFAEPLTSSERLEQLKKKMKKTGDDASPRVFINRQ